MAANSGMRSAMLDRLSSGAGAGSPPDQGDLDLGPDQKVPGGGPDSTPASDQSLMQDFLDNPQPDTQDVVDAVKALIRASQSDQAEDNTMRGGGMGGPGGLAAAAAAPGGGLGGF